MELSRIERKSKKIDEYLKRTEELRKESLRQGSPIKEDGIKLTIAYLLEKISELEMILEDNNLKIKE